MANYDIKADITANTKGYEAGIKKAQESTKKFSTSLSKVIQGLGKNGLVGAMGSIGLASAGLSATLGAVVKIAKQVSQAIGECTEAYKQQLIAERQLETAINNNPLVTGSAKRRLTEFASEMQKVSNYGDEELIPMMANLVSLGRTEEETMKIMAVAMDMSASGSMSLDTAITQLNATLNGNIGRLGQQNAELKGLTEEELKSGKAIDILGEKFKGLAQSTVDTSKQLKNIKGDFKEAIGEFTLPSSDMWNKFWTGFYEKGIEIINKFNDALDKGIIGKGIASSLEGELKKLTDTRERRLYSEDEIHLLSDEQLKALRGYLESLKKLNKEQQVLLQVAKDEKDSREYNAKIAKEIQEDEAKLAKIKAEEAEKEKVVVDLKAEYLDKIKKQETEWENIKKITGEAVTAEEKLKFYQNSLVSLMTEAGGQITENNQLYKDQIAIIQKLQKEINPEEKKTSTEWEKKLREQAIERLEAEKAVDLERAKLLEQSDWQLYQIERQYNEKIKRLSLERVDAEMEEALKAVAEYANAEEEKARITEYYKNEREQIIDEYTAIYKDNSKQEKKATEKTLKETLKLWKDYAKKVGSVMKEIGGAVSDALKSIASFIKTGVSDLAKLFSLNIDEALEKLLEFEDRILTFFMSTLPRLPSFVQSALQSIQVLFQTLENSIDGSLISNIIQQMVQSLVTTLPSILSTLGNVISKIIGGILDGIGASLPSLNDLAGKIGGIFADFAGKIKEQAPLFKEVINGIADLLSNFVTGIVDSGLIDDLADIAGDIVTSLVNGLDKMLPAISEALGAIIPALGKFITDSIPSIVNLLIDVAILIVKEVPKILSELIKALPVIVEALLEALPKFFDEGLPELIAGFIQIIPDIIKAGVQITVELIKHLPEIIGSFIKGLVLGFAQVNWWEVIKSIFQAFIDGFKELFGIHSPSTVFRDFGKNIWQGLMNGLKGIGDWFVGIFTKALDGIKQAFSTIGDWFKTLWANIKSGFSNAWEGVKSTAQTVGEKVGDFFGNVWEGTKNVASTVGEKVGNFFKKLKFWADGTNNAPAGLAVVGEAGPELVKFRGGEQVLNTKNTQKALSSAGTSNSFNVTFNNLQDTTAFALMQQLKQYNRQMAINGII